MAQKRHFSQFLAYNFFLYSQTRTLFISHCRATPVLHFMFWLLRSTLWPERIMSHNVKFSSLSCIMKDYCMWVSDYRHIVHDDGFVWLMFVHVRFSASEQTLNSQNHGVHYMSVITRLTCNNSSLLMRNSPDWQTYRDDTADDMVLCISGIVLGMTGLRLWLACVHKGNIRTS